MTNREAIDILEEVKALDDSIYAYSTAYAEALDKAIDSLRSSSPASCGDIIGRQAAIAHAISGRVRTLPTSEDGENWIRTEEVRQSLLTMPSAQPDLSSYSDKLWRAAYERGKAEAQPQRMRGRWIDDAKTYYEMLIKKGLSVDEYTPYFTDDIACSECLAKYSVIDNETQFFKYCPNCGAQMENGGSAE